jgi:hypothetical protein
LTYHIHPLTTIECGADFNLQNALRFGILRSLFGSHKQQHYLQSYVASCLREEVLQEGLVRNIGELARFLEIANVSQGPLDSPDELDDAELQTLNLFQ